MFCTSLAPWWPCFSTDGNNFNCWKRVTQETLVPKIFNLANKIFKVFNLYMKTKRAPTSGDHVLTTWNSLNNLSTRSAKKICTNFFSIQASTFGQEVLLLTWAVQPSVGHIYQWIGITWTILVEGRPRNILFQIRPVVSEIKIWQHDNGQWCDHKSSPWALHAQMS